MGPTGSVLANVARAAAMTAVVLCLGCGPVDEAGIVDEGADVATLDDGLSAADTAVNVLLRDGFEALPFGADWQDGSAHGRWRAVFNGHGAVGIERDGSHTLMQRPLAAASASETHAALVTTAATFGDLDLSLRMRTLRQLRTPAPNPWEVAWVLWHHTTHTSFYYLVLKPNGWELGKADAAYPGAQRFLATGTSPSFPVGSWNKVRVRQEGATIRAWANDQLLVTFTDRERPLRRGSVGLYNEDAHVRFDDVVVRATR